MTIVRWIKPNHCINKAFTSSLFGAFDVPNPITRALEIKDKSDFALSDSKHNINELDSFEILWRFWLSNRPHFSSGKYVYTRSACQLQIEFHAVIHLTFAFIDFIRFGCYCRRRRRRVATIKSKWQHTGEKRWRTRKANEPKHRRANKSARQLVRTHMNVFLNKCWTLDWLDPKTLKNRIQHLFFFFITFPNCGLRARRAAIKKIV